MKIINLFVLSIWINCMALSAQIVTPVQANYQLSKNPVKKGDEITLIFTLNIDNNWHVYSNIQNYQLGPLPTSFEFEPHNSYKLLGDVQPIGSKKEYEPVFEVEVNYFEKIAEFRQKIKVCLENPTVKGYYEYQVCNDLDGMCIMQTEDFEFKIQTIK